MASAERSRVARLRCSSRPSPLRMLRAAAIGAAVLGSAPSSSEASSACPVPLVEVGPSDGSDGDVLTLSEQGLAYLSSLQAPLFVVPAVGVYRSGKSHMLNRLRGLSTPYGGGFGVGHTRDTFTRGIQICGEAVEGLGTVVWMDTEGLFSAEEAEGAYGPKIFSLALLFSSTVLLNSKSVLSNEFFNYFAEQQQVARVLKQGLNDQGLPEEALLPRNLSLIWVLQQPQHYDGTGEGAQEQLERFLDNGEDARKRVRDDFRHVLREVPVVAFDTRKFRHIESLTDAEILPEYISAVQGLRAAVLEELRRARPLHAAGVVAQLRMYVELVRTSQFSSKLVLEVFEESELGTLCASYSQAITEAAGPLPASSLEAAFEQPLADLELRRAEVVDRFHLGEAWQKRLELCLRRSEADLVARNAEQVLASWKAAAAWKAEEGSCFFLDELVRLQRNYSATFGRAFSPAVQAQAIDFGNTLQRTRLVECIRLRDLLWPFVPWLVGPLCGLYFRAGPSGIITMLLHVVVVAGIYVLMQTFGQLPAFLDIDYAVLRRHPALLEALIRWVPPLVPWAAVSRGFGTLGAMRSAWKILWCGFGSGKPSLTAVHMANHMNVLEIKLNIAMSRSRSALKERLDASALEAAACLDRSDRHGAYLALLRGLALIVSIEESDADLSARVSRDVRTRTRELLKAARGAALEANVAKRSALDLERLVMGGDWDDLAMAMLDLFSELAHERQKRAPPTPTATVVQARAKADVTLAQKDDTDAATPFRTPEPKRRSSGGTAASSAAAESRSVTESEPEPAAMTPPTRDSLRRSSPGTAATSVDDESRQSGSDGGQCGATPPRPVRRSLWGWLRGERGDAEELGDLDEVEDEEGEEGSRSRRMSRASSAGASDVDSSAQTPEKAPATDDDWDDDGGAGAPPGGWAATALKSAVVLLSGVIAVGLVHYFEILPAPAGAAAP